MDKSPDAFRTISEVAEILETPAHVLRFWESRFPQIRPVKRAGGRRYYRPADVGLLTGIKRLLHDEGMTIRGVQKILREQGVRYVSGMADDNSAEDDDAALEAALASSSGPSGESPLLPPADAESAQIIALQSALDETADDVVNETAEILQDQDKEEVQATEADTPADVLLPDRNVEPPTPFVPRSKETETELTVRKPPPDDGIPDLFNRMVSAASSSEDQVIDETKDTDHQDEVEVFDFAKSTEGRDSWVDTSSASDVPGVQEVPIEEEAPMAVWAEHADVIRDDTEAEQQPAPTPPMLKVTRIGAATSAPARAPMPSAPPSSDAIASDTPTDGSTIAARLRATQVADLSASDRATLSLLRARARSLKDRLGAPPRLDA